MTKISYDAETRHDGRSYTFTVPDLLLPVCKACGKKVFTEKVDDQITAALRANLHLLTPDEMRKGLERVNMTQKETAERLGIAEATLSRWLNETQVQSRAMDKLLRVFFAFPQASLRLGRRRRGAGPTTWSHRYPGARTTSVVDTRQGRTAAGWLLARRGKRETPSVPTSPTGGSEGAHDLGE